MPIATSGVRAHNRKPSARALAWLGLVLALSCSTDQLQGVSGTLQVEPLVDFGAVALGRRSVEVLSLRNVGRAPLTLEPLSFEQPALADFVTGAAQHEVLLAGESTTVAVSFAPTVLGRRAVRLFIPTDSTETPQASVDLKGLGILADAQVGPGALDFGDVAIHTTRTLNVTLTNTQPYTAEVSVQTPTGTDAAFFTATPTGTVLVPPKSSRPVAVQFAPMRLGGHTATVVVQPCPSCQSESIALTGNGIAATLVANPPSLDYGFTPPHQPATKTTTITNEGTATVDLTRFFFAKGSAPDFTVGALPPVPLALGHAQSVTLPVVFDPENMNAKSGSLVVEYQDPSWQAPQELAVPVTGTGGGPSIQVVPNPLGYPRTAVGLHVDKNVVIRNLGTNPATPLVVTNLEITGSAEFTLVPPNNAPPLTIAPGRQVYLFVRYTPALAGQSTATLEIDSNDPNDPKVLVPLIASASQLGPCSWEVVPPSLDFGAVTVKTRAELSFRITNVGQNECSVANVRLSPATAPEFAITPVSTRMIDPGQSLFVPVDFTPDGTNASYLGEVDFDMSDLANPTGAVPLSGTGLAPCLAVDPNHLDFGDVGLACQPPQQSVQVRNACNVPVGISGVTIGQGTSDAFTIDAGGGARILQPGDDVLISVTYAPKVAGDDSAPLDIQTDLSPAPVMVPLTGHADLRPTQTDTFTLPVQNKVDFLLVVDNSGSMQDKQGLLAANFPALIRTALANHIDFHIAVTTTGLTPYRGGWADCPGGAYGGEDGRFFPVDNSRPRILTPQTPNLAQVFAENVNVGTCTWDEQGLEAMRRALSPPLIDNTDDPNTPQPNDGNAGFLRPDASLYVLWVTDADDGTDGSGTIVADPNYYVQFLLSLKPGRPDLVTASGVIGLPSCPTAEGVGTRYMQVINALGGIVADICSPDWNGILTKIGQDAFTPRSVFPLSHAPDGRNVTVSIDGQNVPETASDGSSNWHFDPTIGLYGAVVFDNGRGPGPNQTVTITYPVPCPPPTP